MRKNSSVRRKNQGTLEQEYQEKLSVLATYCQEEVPPLVFVREALPEQVVVVFERGWVDGKKVQRWTKGQLEEAFPFLAERSDCYVCYAEFFKGWYSLETMKAVYALVVDVDKVPPQLLDWYMRVILPKLKVKPTYIYASGEGTQFIYLLKKPVEVFKRTRPYLKELYYKLQLKYWPFAAMGQKHGTKVDVHGLTQAFRLPGTQTKLGFQSRVYRYGEPVRIEELASWLGVDASKILPLPSSKKRGKRQKLPSNVVVMPRAFGGRAFYDYAYMKALEEVVPGHRYLSLVALAVIAWKCQVPLEELREDLETLVKCWEGRPDHRGAHRMKPSEIDKALRAYNPKATLTTCDTLEEWMGIQLRKERMSKQEQIKTVFIPAGTKARQEKKQERMRAVVELRQQGLSYGEIARRLGISRSLACMLFKEACRS